MPHRRVIGAQRSAALLALALHSAVDWDWEMPALILPMLLLAGALIAQPEESR